MNCTDCENAIKHTHSKVEIFHIVHETPAEHIDRITEERIATVIKPRVPRPLTDAEKRKLRKRAGGDAKPEQLAKLEEAFGKSVKDRERKQHADSARRHRNNGWTQ